MQPYDRDESNPYDQYIIDMFAPEDEVLRWIQQEADRNQLPHISIRPHEGRLLQLFMKAIVARKVVEIGTLAGYSTVWLARALPPDGKLISLEKSSKHAEIARASVAKAGLDDKVTIWEGEALTLLDKLKAQAPFDFVFLDADRISYLKYLEWTTENLRAGGILAVHNAFANGRIVAPENDEDRTVRALHETLASSEHYDASIVGVGDGTLIAVKRS